jgi:hypothetical protein
VVVVALSIVFRKGVSEPEIRLTGLGLQVLGIGTVVWGLRQTRILFGRPSLVALSRAWFHRFPVYGGRVVTANASITAPGATLHARGYASRVARPDATIEARLEVLEQNVRSLNERIDQTQSEIDRQSRAQAEVVAQERRARAKEDQALGARLEATETGGLHISAMGALWLSLGVTLSTAAPELATWLK